MRLVRATREAQLPAVKSLTSFEFDHCPTFNPAPFMQLADDDSWLDKAMNCLLFGPSGVGKTHLSLGLARAMLEAGRRVKFFNALALVQQLQHDKQQLLLPSRLKKLDRFDLLILDDLGYVQKSEAETSVLFELIAHRYERKSLLITANQPFSKWDSIFPNSMMTVAAVDRLVHHAIIFELRLCIAMEKFWSLRKNKLLKPFFYKVYDFKSQICWRSLLNKINIFELVSHFYLFLGQFFLKLLLNSHYRHFKNYCPIIKSGTVNI